MTALRDLPASDTSLYGAVLTQAVGQGALPGSPQVLTATIWNALTNPPAQSLTPESDDTGNATVLAFGRCSFYPTTVNPTTIQFAIACYNGATLVQRSVVAKPYRDTQQHMDCWGTAKFRIPGAIAYTFQLEANPNQGAQEDQNDHSSLVVIQL